MLVVVGQVLTRRRRRLLLQLLLLLEACGVCGRDLDHRVLHFVFQVLDHVKVLLERVLVELFDFQFLFLDVADFLLKLGLELLQLAEVFDCHLLVFVQL